MKSLLVAMALLGQGTYVVYREFVVEPVPILQIATIGAATAFIVLPGFCGDGNAGSGVNDDVVSRLHSLSNVNAGRSPAKLEFQRQQGV
jgi:hypothetical protein